MAALGVSPLPTWNYANIKFLDRVNHGAPHAFGRQKPMEETMCDYSLEHYRSRPAQLGERYETHQFQSRSIGFIAPGDPSTEYRAWFSAASG